MTGRLVLNALPYGILHTVKWALQTQNPLTSPRSNPVKPCVSWLSAQLAPLTDILCPRDLALLAPGFWACLGFRCPVLFYDPSTKCCLIHEQISVSLISNWNHYRSRCPCCQHHSGRRCFGAEVLSLWSDKNIVRCHIE